ncbi:S-adenosyl-L-methionine-dependent methyltransferase [Auricularia subglabra TFB-10046 SS5]|nr:S-adenosyl-L-methionine-dependent methyltransferase [Auricularia subglabra TFB-10046 SS5]
MDDSRGEARVKHVEGRLLQQVDELYMLPADAMEHGRLGLQSLALYLALEGNYPARDAVRAAMVPDPARRRAVLDIGTGSGSWAEAMAREFPHADVLGLDLVAVARTARTPENCRFENANINDGLPAYHGHFDVVHARSITPGLSALDFFVAEAARLLRPGGVLLFGDGDLQLYDEGEPPQPLSRNACAMQTLFSHAKDGMLARGSQLDGIHDMLPMLKDAPYWASVGYARYFIPVGNWKKGVDAREAVMASVLGRDAVMVFSAMKPLLRQRLKPDDVDSIVRAAEVEGETMAAHVNSIWHYAWATRTDEPPPNPSGPTP